MYRLSFIVWSKVTPPAQSVACAPKVPASGRGTRERKSERGLEPYIIGGASPELCLYCPCLRTAARGGAFPRDL
jgi:hypothetical protein